MTGKYIRCKRRKINSTHFEIAFGKTFGSTTSTRGNAYSSRQFSHFYFLPLPLRIAVHTLHIAYYFTTSHCFPRLALFRFCTPIFLLCLANLFSFTFHIILPALRAPLCTFHTQIHISLFLFIRSAIFILLPIVLNTHNSTIILMHSSFNIPSCLRLLLFYQNSVFCTTVFSFHFFCLFKFFTWNCSVLARLKRAFLHFNMRISSSAHTHTCYMHTQLNLTHFFATCKRMSNSLWGKWIWVRL